MHNIDRTQMEFETDAFEFTEDVGSSELESPFSEEEEIDLATELLDISSEAELDQFLGSLIKKAGKAIGKFAKSSTGKALGGILKGAAKAALPILGTAAGGFIGGPLGAKVGGQLASGAGKLLGLELEGLSQEDQEFEVAKQFVRFAGTAAKNAVSAPATVNPLAAAKSAAVAAAKQYAPGLLSSGSTAGSSSQMGRSGRWVRRGNRIVILGV